jgi:hypothetical protein
MPWGTEGTPGDAGDACYVYQALYEIDIAGQLQRVQSFANPWERIKSAFSAATLHPIYRIECSDEVVMAAFVRCCHINYGGLVAQQGCFSGDL